MSVQYRTIITDDTEIFYLFILKANFSIYKSNHALSS